MIDVDLILAAAEGHNDGESLRLRLSEHPELVEGLMHTALPGQVPYQLFSVRVPPGGKILTHDHPEDVIVAYAQDSCIEIEGIEHYFEAGDVICVAAGWKHGVPTNTTENDRISIALKVRRPEGENP